MSNSVLISKISVHWMPPMSSCTLSIYRGENTKEGLSIRANVNFGDRAPDGWQRELSAFKHKDELNLAEAQKLLLDLGQPVWDETVHESLGSTEIRGHTSSLKFWLTCHSPAGSKKATEAQLQEAKTKLLALRSELWK